MLVLSRKIDEIINIGDNIRVVVVAIKGDRVQLGIDAPREINVHRQETFMKIHGQPCEPEQP